MKTVTLKISDIGPSLAGALRGVVEGEDADTITVAPHEVVRAAMRLAGGACPPVDRSCVHRGGRIDIRQCPSCSGVVNVLVYDCSMHASCQLGTKLDGVRSCGGCHDRLAEPHP